MYFCLLVYLDVVFSTYIKSTTFGKRLLETDP